MSGRRARNTVRRRDDFVILNAMWDAKGRDRHDVDPATAARVIEGHADVEGNAPTAGSTVNDAPGMYAQMAALVEAKQAATPTAP